MRQRLGRRARRGGRRLPGVCWPSVLTRTPDACAGCDGHPLEPTPPACLLGAAGDGAGAGAHKLAGFVVKGTLHCHPAVLGWRFVE